MSQAMQMITASQPATAMLGDTRLATTLEWLSYVAATQLAETSVAVETLATDLRHAESRLTGEAEVRNTQWDRRLATARAEWQRGLDALRIECRAQLAEADQLVTLQREEVSMLREEVELRKSQSDVVQRRLTATEAEQRKLLVRARAAVRRAEAAEAEAAEATAAADTQSEEHAQARKRAESERDVLVSALAIIEGSDEYLDVANDSSHSVGAREEALLRAKLRSMSQLVRTHAAGAAGAAHAVADAQMLQARAERRAAALEKRLQACEAELGARRMAQVQAASLQPPAHDADGRAGALTLVGSGAGGTLVAPATSGSLQPYTGGSSEAAHLRKMVERCAIVEEMSAARADECEALASQLVEARAEGRIAAEIEASWIARGEQAQARVIALEELLAASEGENVALRREVQARTAELQAEVAHHRALAEGSRLALRQTEAAEKAIAAGVDIDALLALGVETALSAGDSSLHVSKSPKKPPPVGAKGDLASPASPAQPFVGVHGFSGMLPGPANNRPRGREHDLPRCQAARSSSPFLSSPSSFPVHPTGDTEPSPAAQTPSSPLQIRMAEDLGSESSGSELVSSAVPGSPADRAQRNLRTQIADGRKERGALAENLRLSRREVMALRRAAEADAAQKVAYLARIDVADERIREAESRRSAFQSLAEAQAKELDKVGEQLDMARSVAGGAGRLQATLEAGAAQQAERLQLVLRGEALLREELQRAAVENEDLRTKLHKTGALLGTQESLVDLLGERLDAQADLARMQIGLPARADADQTNAPGKPRLVRLKLHAESGGGDDEPKPKREMSPERKAALAAADAAILVDDDEDDVEMRKWLQGGDESRSGAGESNSKVAFRRRESVFD